METYFKFFLVKNDQYVLGPGRIALLRLVAEHGSLWKAAREMGMSYRWAWGRIKNSEDALGVPLLTQSGKQTKGKAKTLSPEAREIIEWYTRTEEELRGVLAQAKARQPKALGGASPLPGEPADPCPAPPGAQS